MWYTICVIPALPVTEPAIPTIYYSRPVKVYSQQYNMSSSYELTSMSSDIRTSATKVVAWTAMAHPWRSTLPRFLCSFWL
jgi:hypothetical protein